jgi:CRISPR-associated exonuclease Cas4
MPIPQDSEHSHQRQPVELTPELRADAIATIQTVRSLLHTGTMPAPVYTNRCRGCSLYSRCLPQASKKVSRYQEEF